MRPNKLAIDTKIAKTLILAMQQFSSILLLNFFSDFSLGATLGQKTYIVQSKIDSNMMMKLISQGFWPDIYELFSGPLCVARCY